MEKYQYITLREKPDLKKSAAEWFNRKWKVPIEAYLECMEAYLQNETEYGWYLCLDGNQIIGGMGVIENDFHDRKDLAPNVCAVFTDEKYRGQGIAGNLLNMVVDDMKSKGISPIYLVTDHIGFYEKYGWEFLCMVQGDEASMEFDTFKGTYNFKLRRDDDADHTLNLKASLAEGEMNVYIGVDGKKELLRTVKGGESCDETITLDDKYDNEKTIYVILESSDKCIDGDFEFEYN